MLVIVTRYVPAVAEFSVQADGTVAFALILTGLAGQVTPRPLLGLTTAESPIVPAKLLVLVSEMETAAPVAPELKFTGVTSTMVKSPTCTGTVVWWAEIPGEPVAVTFTE